MKWLASTLLIYMFFISCENQYGFDFNDNWNWESLEKTAKNEQTIDQIQQLKEKISLDEAKFIFSQLTLLKNPNEIQNLSVIEQQQMDWGGGFYGYVPNYFKEADKIPVPQDFDSLIECAVYLNNIRYQINRIISRPGFRYQVTFLKREIPKNKYPQLSPGLNLRINTSALQSVLDLYGQNRITFKEAQKVAENEVFQRMLLHRKNLGYIPEPLPGSEDLARFIYYAGSKKPLPMVWKWINPWNYFGYADLFLNQEEYQKLIKDINLNKDVITGIILGKIDYGVNWGIRCWTTEKSLGSNLIQVKDDYPTFIRTMTHEVFHRIQISLCPVDPERQQKQKRLFEDLVYWNFENASDQKFYEVLTYIFLEGSATYVGGKEKQWLIVDGVKDGRDLLNQVFVGLYFSKNQNIVDECMSMGFKSNGPFYAIGYQITKVLVKKYGNQIVGELLTQGSLEFFQKYIGLEKKFPKNRIRIISDEIADKISELAKASENSPA